MGEGERGSIFPAPKEPCFALFSKGEKESSSIFFVEGGRGGTSGWGCPGAVAALGGWRAEGSLLSSVVPMALSEIPSAGMHRAATKGNRHPCVLYPAWETSQRETRLGGHPEGCCASWQGGCCGMKQHLPSLILCLPSQQAPLSSRPSPIGSGGKVFHRLPQCPATDLIATA